MWVVVGAVLVSLLVPTLARAQVDVLVESVQLTPAQARPDEPVRVRALVRRLGGPNLSALKSPVEIEVEIGLVADGKPFALRKLSLGLDQAQSVEAPWSARLGQHVVRVRIARVALKGQPLQDVNPGNNERVSAVLLVRPSDTGPPGGGPAPPSSAGPLPAGAGAPSIPAPGLPLLGTVAGVLLVRPTFLPPTA